MCRLIATSLLLLLAGCQTVVGPVERARQCPQWIDDPRLTIGEQERKGRDRLALPENSPTVAPLVPAPAQ